MSSSSSIVQQVEVGSVEDEERWRVPLKEEVFGAFMAAKAGDGNPLVQEIFGEKSLFGPLLFKKFFDPSDAFPLWEFEPTVLLSHLQNPCVHWFQTEASCILKSQLPKKTSVGVDVVENGKVIEISGIWKTTTTTTNASSSYSSRTSTSSKREDWRSGKWWEHGFVRRLELPDNTDSKKMEVYLYLINNNCNDTTLLLDIKLPKTTSLIKVGNEAHHSAA